MTREVTLSVDSTPPWPAPQRSAAGHALRCLRRHRVAHGTAATAPPTVRQAGRCDFFGPLDRSRCSSGKALVGRLFIIRSRRTPYWLSLRSTAAGGLAARARGRGRPGSAIVAEGKDLLLAWRHSRGIHLRLQRLQVDARGRPSRIAICAWRSETPTGVRGPSAAARPTVSRAAHLVITRRRARRAGEWLAQRGLTGRHFVVIHPGSRHIARRAFRSRSAPTKYWPEERWG